MWMTLIESRQVLRWTIPKWTKKVGEPWLWSSLEKDVLCQAFIPQIHHLITITCLYNQSTWAYITVYKSIFVSLLWHTHDMADKQLTENCNLWEAMVFHSGNVTCPAHRFNNSDLTVLRNLMFMIRTFHLMVRIVWRQHWWNHTEMQM